MRQRKKEEMYPLVAKWQKSGQSKLDFSQAHGLKAHSFHYWVKKYEKEKDEKEYSSSKDKFIPVSVRSIPSTQLELSYPNGVRLQINGQVSSDYVRQLIKLGTNV